MPASSGLPIGRSVTGRPIGYRAHFGVAVSSVTDRLPKYASLLGVERWTGVHFRVAPGSLEHSIFNGQVVDNAWLLAITDVADFGMELLQGTREPTDYGQTVERIGEGIHHVLVRRDLSPMWSGRRCARGWSPWVLLW